MGVRILDGGDDGAVFYDSVTMTAFGPVFAALSSAEDFLAWLDQDPRVMSEEDLTQSYSDWVNYRDDAESKPFNYVDAQQYRERLLIDYFFEHGGNFEAVVEAFMQWHEVSIGTAIEELYYCYAFGVSSKEE